MAHLLAPEGRQLSLFRVKDLVQVCRIFMARYACHRMIPPGTLKVRRHQKTLRAWCSLRPVSSSLQLPQTWQSRRQTIRRATHHTQCVAESLFAFRGLSYSPRQKPQMPCARFQENQTPKPQPLATPRKPCNIKGKMLLPQQQTSPACTPDLFVGLSHLLRAEVLGNI